MIESIPPWDFVKWVGSILIFLVTLYFTVRHFKIVRTIAYIERFNSPSMIQTRAIVEKWAKGNNQEKIRQIREDKEIYYHVNLIYNMITEIGISYQYRVINRKLACIIFDPLIPAYWDKMKVFILNDRAPGATVGYGFEKIALEILKSRNKKFKRKRKLKALKEIEKFKVLKDTP